MTSSFYSHKQNLFTKALLSSFLRPEINRKHPQSEKLKKGGFLRNEKVFYKSYLDIILYFYNFLVKDMSMVLLGVKTMKFLKKTKMSTRTLRTFIWRLDILKTGPRSRTEMSKGVKLAWTMSRMFL